VSRRRVPVELALTGGEVQVWHLPALQLAAAVRASAAFPGIAPKWVRFKLGARSSSSITGTRPQSGPDLRRSALCADGGIWNNLGTQAIREETTHRGLPILCVNASALAKKSRAAVYFVPGVALVAAFVRIMAILNRNTVEPRVDSILRDLERRMRYPAMEAQSEPPTVVADMRPIAASVDALSHLGVSLEQLTATPWWGALADADPSGAIRTRTTLSRVNAEEAKVLLLRGYANAWLASLLLRNFDERELDRPHVSDVLARLHAIGS
jgi:hypothetical protein